MNHPIAPVTHDDARAILSRFNQSHWWPKRVNETGERARYSIPFDEERDDDVRLERYINQNRAADKARSELWEAFTLLARWCANSLDDTMPGYVCENPIASAAVRLAKEQT